MLTQTVPGSPTDAPQTRRMLVVIVLVALALRLAVIPFNSFLFEDLMDANHIHAWEQGNVAASSAGRPGLRQPA